MAERVVVVTGASTGIGAVLAEQLGTRGDAVVLVARRADVLQDVVARCGPKAVPMTADMTIRADVQRVVADTLARATPRIEARLDRFVRNGGGDFAAEVAETLPVELALEVGIRASSTDPLGKKSHLVHAIDRLAHNHVVSRLGDRVLGLRVAVSPVSQRALAKVPDSVREAHEALVRSAQLDS